MTGEEALKAACIDAERIFWEQYFAKIDSEPAAVIPLPFREAVLGFIRELEAGGSSRTELAPKRRKTLRTLLIAAIIAVLLAVTAFAVEPIRSFIVDVYSDCLELHFHTFNNDDYLYSAFSYIPDGYELVSENKSKTNQTIYYSNGTDYISIDIFTNSKSSVGFNRENTLSGEIDVGTSKGYYSVSDSISALVWSDGKYYCTITSSAGSYEIPLDELVRIAQSRHPKNSTITKF